MPDKQHDINKQVDPELIRRYLAGQLDDKAMHLLERQAMDDPFLAEALEGFAGHTPDQQANLSDLGRRLEKRVAKKKVRAIHYVRWAAAAAILILLGVGVMKLLQTNEPVKQEIAKTETKTQDTLPPGAVTDESGHSQAANADQKVEIDGLNTMTLSKPVPPATWQQLLKKPVMQESPVAAVPPAAQMEPQPSASAPMPAILADKARQPEKDMVAAKEAAAETSDLYKARKQADSLTPAADYAAPVALAELAGRAPGIAVSRARTKKMSDSGNTDELEDVSVGKKFKSSEVYRAPIPAGGFDNYKTYLAKNTRYPAAGVPGTVRIAFKVRQDGTLTHFRVVQSLQKDCDAEAIRVVKEGPAWLPASGNKTARVEVEVKFVP